MPDYFLLYKPYGIVSQFSGEESESLKSLYDFPGDVYPVGRLDKDSEGLLLLTNDKSLNHRLLEPKFAHRRTYLAQVEGKMGDEGLKALENGVKIKVGSATYLTKKARASKMGHEPELPPRNPPIRYRKNVPDTWIRLSLFEGKNRQVRKMTAAVGFPTLRLVRWSIEDLCIRGFEVGEVRQFSQEEIYRALQLKVGTGGPYVRKKPGQGR